MEAFVNEHMNLILDRLRGETERLRQWEDFEAQIARRRAEAGDVINLNVGGKQISTLRSTLTRYPGTMLEAMFSGRHEVARDAEGRAFLDRNSAIFEIILEWLRTGVVADIPSSLLKFMVVELDYYGLGEVFPNLVSLDSFTIEIGTPYAPINAQNTADSLRDGSFLTGVCLEKSGPIITFKFEAPVRISKMSVGAVFVDPTRWCPTNGGSAAVEFQDPVTNDWTQVATLPSDFGSVQQLETVTWAPRMAFKWRVRSNPSVNDGHLGLSQVKFEK